MWPGSAPGEVWQDVAQCAPAVRIIRRFGRTWDMVGWSSEEDEALVELAHLGAEGCRRELAARFGIRRSAAAVQRHGSRLGVSFRRLAQCDGCGGWFAAGQLRGGLCGDCRMRSLIERHRARLRAAEDNSARGTQRALKREYDRVRQAAVRAEKRSETFRP